MPSAGLLVEQVTGRVRWRESVLAWETASRTLAEAGAGKVLSGMAKRIDPEMPGGTPSTAPPISRAFCKTAAYRRRRKPMFDLTGKTALVTGASGGIGGAIAEALHRRARRWRCRGTRAEALEELAASWASARMSIAVQSVRRRGGREAGRRRPRRAMGKLDILVNNAGITRDMLRCA